jgi:hypothetical protein
MCTFKTSTPWRKNKCKCKFKMSHLKRSYVWILSFMSWRLTCEDNPKRAFPIVKYGEQFTRLHQDNPKWWCTCEDSPKWWWTCLVLNPFLYYLSISFFKKLFSSYAEFAWWRYVSIMRLPSRQIWFTYLMVGPPTCHMANLLKPWLD